MRAADPAVLEGRRALLTELAASIERRFAKQ
jgi:hypothetical protein